MSKQLDAGNENLPPNSDLMPDQGGSTKPPAPDANGSDNQEDDVSDLSNLDEKTKKYIDKLRKENAKYRTDAKGLKDKVTKIESGLKQSLGLTDEEEVAPEEQIGHLQAQSEALAFKNAVLETAMEFGLSGQQVGYFEYLLANQAQHLEEGEELSDEVLESLIQQSRSVGGGGNQNSSTSVSSALGGQKKPDASGKVSLDAFLKMSITEKSQLYTKDQATYNALMAEARGKKAI